MIQHHSCRCYMPKMHLYSPEAWVEKSEAGFSLFFFVILPVTEPLQPGNNQVGAALTSAARGNAGIWSQWPQGNLRAPGPSLFLPSHYSFICLSFGEPLRAVVIATTGPADALGDYFLTEFLPEFSPQKVGPPRPNSCVCLHTCKRGRSSA